MIKGVQIVSRIKTANTVTKLFNNTMTRYIIVRFVIHVNKITAINVYFVIINNMNIRKPYIASLVRVKIMVVAGD